jgi:hypothetical protein
LRLIADTSVWIDYLRGKESVKILKDFLENQSIVVISVIFGELLQGVKSEAEKEIVEDFWKHIPKINEFELMIRAGKYSYKEKLISKGVGLIDSVLIVAAEENDLKIWTLDKKLLNVLPKRLKFEI